MASLGIHLRLLVILLCASLPLISCGGGGANDTSVSADSALSSLTLSAGTLSPSFSATHSSYFVSVDSTVSTLQVNATTANSAAALLVNGVRTSSGAASSPIGLAFGTNGVDIAVTAEDGVTTRRYHLTIVRGANDATLSALTLNAGALSPTFSSTQADYSVSVNWAVTTLQLTATTNSSLATLTVNGVSTPSGANSSAIALAVGVNTVDIVVTAGDGVTTKTYHLTIMRSLADPSLSSLALSSGTLGPTFSAAQTSYSATVGSAVTTIQVVATTASNAAMLTVNGISTPSGANSSEINLAVGTNNISIVVTAQDGITTQVYNVVVTRVNNDATLNALTLSAGALSPAFFSGQTSYATTVGSAVTTVQVTATTTSGAATMTVNGVSMPSGASSSAINLAVGVNNVSVVVTAQDGVTINSYNITIVRGSSDATLSSLTLSAGTLSPVFSASQTGYSATVTSGTATMQVTATTASGAATMTVNGVSTPSGTASSTINLAPGTNNISVIVTAQDGITSKAYSISVTRGSGDATLSALTLSTGTLSPIFASGQTSYSATVGLAVLSIQLTGTTNSGTATMTVNGVSTPSGTASSAINLTPGTNNISIVVTAQDGVTTKTYSVTVTRGSIDATLSALTLTSGTLSPVFSSAETSYSTTVSSGTNSIQVTVTTTRSAATMTVNGVNTASGVASSAISLPVGTTLISIVVTAEDGTTTKTYSVSVTRPSTDATLTALSLSTGTLNPAFSSGQTSYSVTVGSVVSSTQVTANTTSGAATLTINGASALSGASSAGIGLAFGSTTVDVVVTAQDGVTTKTYSIAIDRGTTDANLSGLTLTSATLNPGFSAAQTGYSVLVATAVTSIQVTATTASDIATMTVNGTSTPSGMSSAAVTLAIGVTTVNVVVTAQDGVTTKTYSLTIARGNADATLSALSISAGTLDQIFQSAQLSYTASTSFLQPTTTVTASTTDANATLQINGLPITSGAASNDINLIEGSNNIIITVTAQNALTARTYTIAVTRLALNANVLTIAGGGAADYIDATGTAAKFSNPTGITTDGAYLFIADTDNHVIRQLELATNTVSSIAGTGVEGYVDNTVSSSAQFRFPTGITTDGINLFIADTGNSVIRHFDLATGVVSTFAGTGTQGNLGGTRKVAQFNFPGGITIDGSILYVADTGNHVIRQIDVATGAVSAFAGSGVAGYADGTGAAAQFNNPFGITTDGVNIYVSDSGNHRIRKIVIATGVVSTLAGGSSAGYQDGMGTTALFNFPVGITTDGENLYVSDQNNNRIRKVVIASGVVNTLAGQSLAGGLDARGIAAKFNTPDGITHDGSKLYVTDLNHAIRQID